MEERKRKAFPNEGHRFASRQINDFSCKRKRGKNELAARPATPQPTLKGAAYRLLGAICKHFPKQTSKKHGQEARIKSALMSELRIQVESTAQKLDLSVVEGCLKGNLDQ